jgi:hypothetical protein
MSWRVRSTKQRPHLRFRKPNNYVYLDLTSSANPHFVHNSDQLVPTSPSTNLSVCATSVQLNYRGNFLPDHKLSINRVWIRQALLRESR